MTHLQTLEHWKLWGNKKRVENFESMSAFYTKILKVSLANEVGISTNQIWLAIEVFLQY